MSEIFEQAKLLKSWGVKHRRYLHQHPELSLKEKETSIYCQNVMKSLGYDIKNSWGFGFTADLIVDPHKQTIALRTDIDALPIQEQNSHEFVSKNNNVGHMCGHDMHMAIALTTAKLLSEKQRQLAYNVRFIFQPSEELPPGGALGMIEAGCLQGVSEVYGLHNDPGTPIGKIRTKIGTLLAASDNFECEIQGRGCHAARPQDGLDPIYAAAAVVTDWQSIISRKLNPVHPAVISVTQFHAGQIYNIIPDHARLLGTIRSFDPRDRELIPKLMQISFSTWKQLGYKFDYKWIKGYDSVINHKSGVDRVVRAASTFLQTDNIDENTESVGWGEDFAYYLQHCPGAFYFLGSGNMAKGIVEPLHSSRFDADEDAIPIGVAIMATLVLQSSNNVLP